MPRHSFFAAAGLLTFFSFNPTLSAADPNRDFSGRWTLDTGSSRVQSLDIPAEPVLTIVQQETAIHCSTNASYMLDGKETRYRVAGSTFSSAVKWEGNALLINTLVTGPRDYTVMDRWKLSRDHTTLTITRQVMRSTLETEGVLVYRGEGWQAPAVAPPAESPRVEAPMVEAPPSAEAPRPILMRPEARAPRPSQGDVMVPAGTRIALMLRNAVDTKHSREGDRIYLETIYPVAAGGRMVIPAGSFVNGTITMSKPAGKAKGKGEMYIRFDSLTLPNGATRDFRSHLGSAEGKTVDREEGKISGERDTGHDVGRVATTTGAGASIGGIAGAASGHAIQGVGIGAAIGAAVGLATILGKRGPEATLLRGTTLEMILDRDISFTAAELRWY
jgi:type IV secretion system protein VirB10